MTERDVQRYWVFAQVLHTARTMHLAVTAADALADMAVCYPRLVPNIVHDLQIEERRRA